MTTLNCRLRGLAATAALVGFMVGVPAVLLAINAIPNPGAFAWSRLTAPDDGSLAMEVIAAVCWIAWAIFTCQLIASIVSQIRGIRAPRLPGLVVPQLAADRLVAAAALLFVAIPTATAFLPQPKAEAAVTATPLPDAAPLAAEPAASELTTHHVAPTTKEPTTERYTVKRGDSLWKIAEERLGDGTRYVELVDLNEAVLNGRPDFLLPGTVLKVPVAETAPEGDYVVQPGDTLAEIAEDELGDADAYPSIFEASRDTVQANGARLSDPDLILPGWRLTIPGHTDPREPTKPKHVQEPTVPETTPPADVTPVPEVPTRAGAGRSRNCGGPGRPRLAVPWTGRCGRASRRLALAGTASAPEDPASLPPSRHGHRASAGGTACGGEVDTGDGVRDRPPDRGTRRRTPKPQPGSTREVGRGVSGSDRIDARRAGGTGRAVDGRCHEVAGSHRRRTCAS